VFTRKEMIDRMLAGEPVDEVLAGAVVCLVTREESKRLTRQDHEVPSLRGWERYQAAGIEVVDMADGI
jgi:hypothetical protein